MFPVLEFPFLRIDSNSLPKLSILPFITLTERNIKYLHNNFRIQNTSSFLSLSYWLSSAVLFLMCLAV